MSPPFTGLLLGVLVGIADAVILQTDFGRSRGSVFLPPFTWLVVIWTWVTTGCLTGVLFSSPRWGPLRGVALALAGPCLLLLGRGVTPFKTLTHLSTMQAIAIWAAISVVICCAFAFLRFEKAESFWKYAGVGAISALLLVWFAAGGRMPMGEGPRTVVAGKHNVALIVLDTVRQDDAAAYMPELSEFSKNATTFDNAWSPAPWTVPSHFALLTGTDPWSVPFRGMTSGYEYGGPHLAEQFRARGYQTGAVFSNPLLNEGIGFDRGFADFTVSVQSRVCRSAIGVLLGKSVFYNGPRMPLCSWLLASEVSGRTMQLVRRGGGPFFVATNFMDAHNPYYVPRECRDVSYRPIARRHQELLLEAMPGRHLDPRIAERTRAQYRMAMRCMDRALGALLARLDDGNTVIAVVGDHGEQFGEHGFGGHGNSVYRQVLHVPLILKIPGHAAARVHEPVSITDLYPSLLRASEPGRMRAPIPLLDASRRRPVISSVDHRLHRSVEGGFSVVRGELHLIRLLAGRETLYDYRRDPEEILPLTGLRRSQTVEPLRELLLRAAARQRQRAEFDALGYLN